MKRKETSVPPECQNYDRKSLRLALGKTADWQELASDCVSFATTSGGKLEVGIEDGDALPPPDQRIPRDLPERFRKRIAELAVNVTTAAVIKAASNRGEYLEVTVPRSPGVPSTVDGRFFIRLADGKRPVLGDEVLRLAGERTSFSWEAQVVAELTTQDADSRKVEAFVTAIRASERVKQSVKEKTNLELLAHYNLTYQGRLTNLGVLIIGQQQDRARLGTAPTVQAIRYDGRGEKVWKEIWDDHSLTPPELIDAIWSSVPDFRETYDIPVGLLKDPLPAYDRAVVRELLVNALVHRPYTQGGDIFLNLHPDRLTIVNPGPFPIGVTPGNVLHTTVRRNDGLARIFHDLKLMEAEGSGYDMIYEILLTQGRALPEPKQGPDRVEVTVCRRVLVPEVIAFIDKADTTYQLTQRERICLGLLAQHDGLKVRELAELLDLDTAQGVAPWLGRLVEFGLVGATGKTKGSKYFVVPEVLKSLDFPAVTSLARIQPHRLEALVYEDVERYPKSAIGEVHKRIGKEVPRHQVKVALEALCARGRIMYEGERRWRRYSIAPSSSIEKDPSKTEPARRQSLR